MQDQPIRILMVEDSEDDYILTEALLTDLASFSFELKWIDQFDTALHLMRQNQHDVYLLDHHLGKHTGLDILRAATAGGCKGPIIFLTGQGDHLLDMEAMEAGAVDYLIKNQIDGPVLERSIRYAIQQKRVEAEIAEMQLRLAESREQERLHIAQELHDGPLQDLMGVHFHLSALSNLIDADQTAAQVEVIQTNLQAATQALRSLCIELRPPVLAPFGLSKAIRAYVKDFQEHQPPIKINLDLDADNQLLPERVRLALYRICQHALTNVANHADASEVKIIFRLDSLHVTLQVLDNGKGFRVPTRWIEFAREGHLGLIGSSERAEAIGGHLEVQSAPEQGTKLIVVVPRSQMENI